LTIIGLTGGIGSGKSTVAKMLKDLGAVIIDADQVAREVVEPGQPLLAKIARKFGENCLTEQGELNRQILASIVFSDEGKRKTLNRLIHPVIKKSIENRIKRIKEVDQQAIIVLEAPLLIEAKMTTMVDEVWVTELDSKLQLKRIISRDGLKKADALKRIKSQISPAERRSFAKVIFKTEKELEELRKDVAREWTRILACKGETQQFNRD